MSRLILSLISSLLAAVAYYKRKTRQISPIGQRFVSDVAKNSRPCKVMPGAGPRHTRPAERVPGVLVEGTPGLSCQVKSV
jgi:hypothetical protein